MYCGKEWVLELGGGGGIMIGEDVLVYGSGVGRITRCQGEGEVFWKTEEG